MIYWFMGYPGVGKDYCAKQLSQLLRCPHTDADDFLTDADKRALQDGTFTQQDRLNKLARICDALKSELRATPNITIGDSLPDEKSRRFVLDSLAGDVTIILVQAPAEIHRKRLKNRQGHFFTEDLLDSYIKTHWEPVTIPHLNLINDTDDKSGLIDKLRLLVASK